jgi:hypothetical protein
MCCSLIWQEKNYGLHPKHGTHKQILRRLTSHGNQVTARTDQHQTTAEEHREATRS